MSFVRGLVDKRLAEFMHSRLLRFERMSRLGILPTTFARSLLGVESWTIVDGTGAGKRVV
jgi:hypothetical protein